MVRLITRTVEGKLPRMVTSGFYQSAEILSRWYSSDKANEVDPCQSPGPEPWTKKPCLVSAVAFP